jgi:hypothetical protein
MNTLLLFILLLALTHRQTDRQRNKYTRFAWAGGIFFPVVLYVVSVFGSGEKKGFGLQMHVLLRVQYSCDGVLVFWLQWEIDFSVLHIVYNTVMPLCQFFGCSGK